MLQVRSPARTIGLRSCNSRTCKGREGCSGADQRVGLLRHRSGGHGFNEREEQTTIDNRDNWDCSVPRTSEACRRQTLWHGFCNAQAVSTCLVRVYVPPYRPFLIPLKGEYPAQDLPVRKVSLVPAPPRETDAGSLLRLPPSSRSTTHHQDTATPFPRHWQPREMPAVPCSHARWCGCFSGMGHSLEIRLSAGRSALLVKKEKKKRMNGCASLGHTGTYTVSAYAHPGPYQSKLSLKSGICTGGGRRGNKHNDADHKKNSHGHRDCAILRF